MTYCLGIKLKAGLVGIANTRKTAGLNTTTNRNVLVHQGDGSSLFIMISGIRSECDNAVHYFQEPVIEGMVYDKL